VRIDSEQVHAHLKRGLQPLYTVYGDEALLALEAADRIRAQARAAGYTEREVLSVESGFNWSALAMTGNSLSLFGARRILELRIVSGKPGTEGAEAIKRYAADLPPDTVTLVLLPKLDRATLATAWFEALDAAGVSVAANPVLPDRLPQWLAGRLEQQGQQADQATLQFLADMVEGNLLAAQQEVQKLALLFPPGTLNLEAVEPAIADVARYDVFKLGETLLAGDRARFVRMLEGLKGEGVAPPLVLWAIAEEIRTLLRVATAVSRRHPLQAAMRDARVWGARAELLPRALRRVQVAELEEALLDAAAADRVGKGLVRGDVWEELLRLGLRLMPPAPRPAEGNRGKIPGQSASASKPR
jgi:DNA polymerase-3 subunit delta